MCPPFPSSPTGWGSGWTQWREKEWMDGESREGDGWLLIYFPPIDRLELKAFLTPFLIPFLFHPYLTPHPISVDGCGRMKVGWQEREKRCPSFSHSSLSLFPLPCLFQRFLRTKARVEREDREKPSFLRQAIVVTAFHAFYLCIIDGMGNDNERGMMDGTALSHCPLSHHPSLPTLSFLLLTIILPFRVILCQGRVKRR